MNNDYNNIRKLKERVLKNFYPVYHAPLVFDIHTQSCYRKMGYVARPKTETSNFDQNKEEEEKEKEKEKEKVKNIQGGGYFAYPKSKSESR